MTIRFLRQWNGHDDQDIVELSTQEEGRLVFLGIATFEVVANKKPFVGLRKSSIYSTEYSASTNGVEQFEAIATGVKVVIIENKSSTISVYAGVGDNADSAKLNRDSGDAGLNRFLIRPGDEMEINIDKEKFCAWIGSGGTALIGLSQGG